MPLFTATVTVSVDEEVDVEKLKSRLEAIMRLTVDEEEAAPEGLAVEIDWETLKPVEEK